MSQIMKAFMGIFLLMLLVVTATGMLGAFLEVSHAQNLHAAIIDEMEKSDYAYSVLEGAFEAAEKNDYSLELVLYYENGGIMKCFCADEIPPNVNEVYMAEVILTYPVGMTFFNLHHMQKLCGYAG